MNSTSAKMIKYCIECMKMVAGEGVRKRDGKEDELFKLLFGLSR